MEEKFELYYNVINDFTKENYESNNFSFMVKDIVKQKKLTKEEIIILYYYLVYITAIEAKNNKSIYCNIRYLGMHFESDVGKGIYTFGNELFVGDLRKIYEIIDDICGKISYIYHNYDADIYEKEIKKRENSFYWDIYPFLKDLEKYKVICN